MIRVTDEFIQSRLTLSRFVHEGLSMSSTPPQSLYLFAVKINSKLLNMNEYFKIVSDEGNLGEL